MQEIKGFSDFMKDSERRSKTDTSRFPFDVDTFENLIDTFTPFEAIPSLLRTDVGTIERFCKYVYGMTFKETYLYLLGISEMYARGAIKNLAFVGNNTALKIMAEHFLGYKDDNKNLNANVTIVNDLKDD